MSSWNGLREADHRTGRPELSRAGNSSGILSPSILVCKHCFQILNVTGQVPLQFSNFHVLLYIHFLSSVELECWLADVAFFPSPTLTSTFKHSRPIQARFSIRPFLAWPEGSGVQTKVYLAVNSMYQAEVHLYISRYC